MRVTVAGSPAPMTELAFMGAGVMGLPMIRNLDEAGFALHVYNRTVERAEPLRDEGIGVFDDAAEAAEGCSVMVTMLSQGDAVLEVAAAALRATDGPETWLQMSTIGAPATERCEALADEYDVTFVDAPVVGTRAPAEQGSLTILASGPEQSRPVAEPVFDAVGARTLWLGDAGVGSRAKVMVNAWVIGVVAALAETLSLGRALELDPGLLFEILDGGPLDLPYARIKGAMMTDGSFDDVSFALSLARKDAQLARAAGDAAGIELPALDGALARLLEAERRGHGDEDMAATYRASKPRA
jgi:3-hydroxyisobutyrate dehydrogenase